MPQQIINLGATGSGAGGDSARTAFEKAIANFAELYIAALPGTAAQKQAARDMFGLGTAATRAVQTGLTDTTAGALMPVGAFGLGAQTVGNRAPALADADSYTTPSGFYRTSNTANYPFGNNSLILVGSTFGTGDGSSDRLFELDFVADGANSSDDIWYRRRAGTAWRSRVKMMHTGNILGTVSQAGGVPTGAIIERGSNAKGEYVRFADGTQICTGRIAIDLSSASPQNINWPATFTSMVPFSLAIDSSPGIPSSTIYDAFQSIATMSDASSRGRVVVRATAPYTIQCLFVAIGRWY